MCQQVSSSRCCFSPATFELKSEGLSDSLSPARSHNVSGWLAWAAGLHAKSVCTWARPGQVSGKHVPLSGEARGAVGVALPATKYA
ncbi:hypothetical protein AOLI_G00321230 [Acnodon oligacanthus]